jgi:hypothetical protein
VGEVLLADLLGALHAGEAVSGGGVSALREPDGRGQPVRERGGQGAVSALFVDG